MIKPRAILFDWDNTLVEGWNRIGHALNAVFKKYSMPQWTELEVKQRAHRSARDVFPEMFKDKSDEALKLFYEEYHGFDEEQKTLEGAEELLKLIKDSNIYCSLVSNKLGSYLRDEVEAKNFTKYFSKIIGAKDTPFDKPSAEPVKFALESAGINLGPHVWFVGDSTIDMLCAKNSESTPILYGDMVAAHDLNQHNISHMHVESHQDLIELLKTVI